jgi:hypothetical protein
MDQRSSLRAFCTKQQYVRIRNALWPIMAGGYGIKAPSKWEPDPRLVAAMDWTTNPRLGTEAVAAIRQWLSQQPMEKAVEPACLEPGLADLVVISHSRAKNGVVDAKGDKSRN